jgi:hypothetical protein
MPDETESEDPAVVGVPPDTPPQVRPSTTGVVAGSPDAEPDVDIAEPDVDRAPSGGRSDPAGEDGAGA